MDGQYTTTAHLFSLAESGIVIRLYARSGRRHAAADGASQCNRDGALDQSDHGELERVERSGRCGGRLPRLSERHGHDAGHHDDGDHLYEYWSDRRHAVRYSVTAFDTAGNVSASSSPPVQATTLTSDTMPPTVPANVTATAVSSSQITVSWSASSDPGSGVAGYHVYRSDLGTTPVTTTTSTSLRTLG